MKWIRTKDEKPLYGTWVIAYPTIAGKSAAAYYSLEGKWQTMLEQEWWQTPTHWMHFPESPKESE